MCQISVADSESTDNSTITLYGLFPVDGPLTSGGESAKVAFNLAISDINTFLKDGGSRIQVKGETTDIGSDAQSALDAIQTLHKSGVTMVITYLSSAQIEAVKDYADSNGVLILSVGSSAPELSIPDDNILRYNTDDSIQALSAVNLFKQDNITKVIPFARDDIWGKGLVHTIQGNLSDTITMDEGIWYDPATTSFTDSLAQLDTKVGDELKTGDASKVAVYVISFDELKQILKDAKSNGYSNLEKVKWYGCDGNALSPALTGSGDVPEYAYKRNFTALSVGPNLNFKQNPVYQSLKKTLGKEPDGYSYGCYDATNIAFRTLLMKGNTDANTLRDEIIALSNSYVGVAGLALKNAAGDAREGHYALWGIVNNNGVYGEKVLAEVASWSNYGVRQTVVFYPVTD
ncbi:MAG: ABC transporter substrate-binding protein [Methanospirillum sp.]|nr:ABC transporter substrate-binding protein [Methanospirillum sp.]